MTAQPRQLAALRAGLCAVFLLVVSLAAPAAARADSIFSVDGRGWGHGIGMTQYGAMGYAQQGKTYDWILAHYFQQTTLSTRVELTVKVDLDAGKAARSSWRIAAPSAATTLTVSDYVNGAHSVEVTRGTSVWVTFKAGGCVLKTDHYNSTTKVHSAGSVIATFSASVLAATGPAAASEVRILGASGPFSQTSIAWRGRIRFTAATTTGHAIDYVPMEQYLRGVVPRESPSSWPVEALRAQAVAARSYAYDAALSGSTLWCTTASQVYNGAADGTTSHESSKTDAAVADTANRFVVYGSAVVQTFFSSSSGGRTANIEDVWLSSTPKPYYTSVADADKVSGNPNYRWSLADMTGTTLAGRIRTHYPSLAQASPATVKTVTLDPGQSGFMRHVTLHWSKGANTTLTGPQFQHALGLKSSAFTVTLKNPPAVATVLTLASSETTVRAGAPFVLSGALRPGHVGSVTVQHKFPGSSTWVTFRTATTKADGTFSCTTATRSLGAHQYRVLGAASRGWLASTSHAVSVAVVYVPLPVWKRYEQNTLTAKYSGLWKTSALAGLSGGTHTFSRETSAAVVYTISGTGVRWIGKRAANYGKAWVSVDRSTPILIDLYSAASLSQQRLFASPTLTAGTHTLTIRVAGKKNAKATGFYVDVDAFDALQPVK